MYKRFVNFNQDPFTYLYNKFNTTVFDKNSYRIVSIDPAVKNFAIRVEDRSKDGEVKMLLFEKIDISSEEKENADKTYSNLSEWLETKNDFFNDIDFVIIEKQLPSNYKAVRVSQQAIAHFICLLIKQKSSKSLGIIVEISPKLKSKLLDAPPKLDKKEVKKWAIEKAKELLNEFNDEISLKILNKERKKDDLSDIVCQIEAFCKYMKLPTLQNYKSKPQKKKIKIKLVEEIK